jgi:glycogen operon protein
VDDTFLILLNAHHEPLDFTLPAHKRGVRWQSVLDTSWNHGHRREVIVLKGGENYPLSARSIALLKLRSQRRQPPSGAGAGSA